MTLSAGTVGAAPAPEVRCWRRRLAGLRL